MKKKILYIFVCMMMVTLSGCQRVTIEDAEKTANLEKGMIARNLTKYHEQKKEADANKPPKVKKRNDEDTGPNTILSEESNKKITVADIGETVSVTTMECQVMDVLLTKNIYDVHSITDEESADSVIKDMLATYGPDSRLSKTHGEVYIQDNGDVGAKFNQFMFVKMKIHYIGKNPKEICMRPTIYISSEDLEYQYAPNIDSETIDKRQHDDADRMYYTFEAGQEEDFVIAFSIRGDIKKNTIYLDTSFVRTDHYSTDPMDIPDGTKFIKLLSGE